VLRIGEARAERLGQSVCVPARRATAGVDLP
jgi:hypothetical protein